MMIIIINIILIVECKLVMKVCRFLPGVCPLILEGRWLYDLVISFWGYDIFIHESIILILSYNFF